jgi:arylsulfatase/uncharacterized sulfatase
LPADFYSSRFLVDRMIEWIDAGNERQPFLAYLAFQAIHIPVQASPERRDRYRDLYAVGWDAVRARREERARALQLAPPEAPLSGRPEGLRAWSTLDEEERALAGASMAVNAGMLDEMDHHLGRLIEHLSRSGTLSNTVFVITSDNGPEPSNPFASPGMETWARMQGYSRDPENLGERNSYAFIGAEWAWAAAAPGSLFKFQTTEGGTRVPLIIAGPGVRTARSDALTTMQDVTPTLLELAGIRADGEDFDGRSLAPLLKDANAPVRGPQDVVAFEVSGNAALYREPYKLVRNAPPWGTGQWELYRYRDDPGETGNLMQTAPGEAASLETAYSAWADRVGVVSLPAGYDMRRQIGINSLSRQAGTFAVGLAVIGVALALVLLLGRAGRRLSSTFDSGYPGDSG